MGVKNKKDRGDEVERKERRQGKVSLGFENLADYILVVSRSLQEGERKYQRILLQHGKWKVHSSEIRPHGTYI